MLYWYSKPSDIGNASGGQIAHCLINRRDTGYGFAEPYFIHNSLKDLVLHYSEASLFEHNDELDTTLRIPVGMLNLPAVKPFLSDTTVEQVRIRWTRLLDVFRDMIFLSCWTEAKNKTTWLTKMLLGLKSNYMHKRYNTTCHILFAVFLLQKLKWKVLSMQFFSVQHCYLCCHLHRL